ncbi:glycosyltransferase family 2 protein [Sporosarcina sp. BI001-red]|uniref:glycosyltransferase family 2 protein n=1 Tax=Sporosarcina sp. BI001-red TaxID=2282866 RepID=UPI000E2240DF|nr:glycosyltransferase family 2 protein [Sporosarcina sp. BI001-red]REB08873.1 glycosyltransferase family 2 protein [Sporosarcina sp. BI001-red]
MQNRTLIIIPAYNEESQIARTIQSLEGFDSFDYLVVNDGSKDRTKTILEENKFHHVSLPVNLGIGGAMQTGYKYAERHGYEYAIQLDADGQHDPSDLVKLLDAIVTSDADMVIGSRFVEKTGYKGTNTRRAGIYYFYTMLRFITGVKVSDPTSGYRIVNRSVIQYFAQEYPVDYPEVEVIVQLARKKKKILEVSVEMNSRQGGVSSITPLKSIYYMLKVTFFSVIRSYL